LKTYNIRLEIKDIYASNSSFWIFRGLCNIAKECETSTSTYGCAHKRFKNLCQKRIKSKINKDNKDDLLLIKIKLIKLNRV